MPRVSWRPDSNDVLTGEVPRLTNAVCGQPVRIIADLLNIINPDVL
jgi:hypothetical protein